MTSLTEAELVRLSDIMWLLAREITIISNEPEKAPQLQQDSHQQPVWHVIVLGMLTLSIYLLYWAYRNWRDLKRQSELPQTVEQHPALNAFAAINPVLRTAGLMSPVIIWLVPLLDWRIKAVLANGVETYLLGTLVVGIAALDPDKKDFAARHPLLACFAALGTYLLLVTLSNLNGAFYLLGLLSVVPFGFVQHWLNKFWDSVEPQDLLIRHGFNFYEMLAIVAGASLIGLSAAGTMIGVPTR